MTTNIEILEFLKADREARAREKEEETVARAKERVDDMKKIEEMLKNAMKIEVMAALEPLEERMNR